MLDRIIFLEIPPGETTGYYEGDVELYIKSNGIKKENHITFAKNASTGHLLIPWMILHTLGHALVEYDVKAKQLHVGIDDSIKTVNSVFRQGVWQDEVSKIESTIKKMLESCVVQIIYDKAY